MNGHASRLEQTYAVRSLINLQLTLCKNPRNQNTKINGMKAPDIFAKFQIQTKNSH